MTSENVHSISLDELRRNASFGRGWRLDAVWQGRGALAAPVGGNQVRFAVQGTSELFVQIATEPYVFGHVYLDSKHVAALGPGLQPARLALPVAPAGTQVCIERSAVSSGPFYVDFFVTGLEAAGGQAVILPPADPVPATVFCTFGDSISGNCCIGPEDPFDPHGLGYGWKICERFGWQYYNTARDGSGVSCRPFDNPLAGDRVQAEVIDAAPDYLLVFYGTNDIRSGVEPEVFARDYDALLGRLVAGLPAARIAASGLLWGDIVTAQQVAQYNDVIGRVCARHGVPCIQPYAHLERDDFYDGVHPNPGGQAKLAAMFGDFFARLWPELDPSRKGAPAAC